MRKLIYILLSVISINAVSQDIIINQDPVLNASATVLSNINVEGLSDLEFGNIFYGDPVTVNTTDPINRGVFRIEQGPGNPNINILFNLPEGLIYQDGGNAVPLEITNWTYAVSGNENDTPSGQPVPTGLISINMASISETGNPRVVYVFIGATVVPIEENPAGSYLENAMLLIETN